MVASQLVSARDAEGRLPVSPLTVLPAYHRHIPLLLLSYLTRAVPTFLLLHHCTESVWSAGVPGISRSGLLSMPSH